MKNILFLLLLMAGIIVACDEDKLTPSEPQEFYEFPQGDSDYDREFVTFYEKYNTQFLYRYNESDFRWNVTSYIPFYSVPADEAYVEKAYHFIKERCLDTWGEGFYKNILPMRILLSSKIYSVAQKYGSIWNEETQQWEYKSYYDTTYHASTYGLNHIAFGYTSEKFDELTPAEQLNAVGELNKSLIGYAASRDKIVIPAEFVEWYDKYRNSVWEGAENRYGFLEYYKDMDVAYDFGLYVKYLTTMSEEAFKAWALSDDVDTSQDWDQASGTYKRTYAITNKYKIVLEYFKTEFNIDLHAIGNQAN
ncbi:hypothetical protein [Butyricimonas synergistica]|uniref:hypothetical protein n=1 Tax=Butyricimonas synergistica TaxID=544644 RepID=UPI00037C8D66|nr:hypothetical protein [Butyricimonas synergistica]